MGDTIKTLSGATVPLSMIVTGISRAGSPMGCGALRDGKGPCGEPGAAAAVPAAGLGWCWGCSWSGTTPGVRSRSSPPAPAGAMVSCSPQHPPWVDDTVASRVNFLSTILCAVTLPVVTSFLL
ncbi:MAG: hypothetical protein ACLT9P_10430 [Evtepia gabavorous]